MKTNHLNPAMGTTSAYTNTKVNAFGLPVDDMIEIGDILKVSAHQNSTRPTVEQVILHNIKAPEMMNKKEPFSLDKLSKINNSLTAPIKEEESALLGKRGSVLQENTAPGKQI
jgi:hypothetical protein